ncbi:MAG TPA: OmpA family protein, partial [Nitrospiraceae bacterium]|nr:OmpA family protein [Nitrospiraceae bacterium]
MKSAAILAAGVVAFALLAFFCLPHHAPPAAVLATPIPANFHARVEYGTLILRGSLPSETSKAAIIHRAQELYGAAPGSVVDELTVDPRMGPVAWAENVSLIIPALGHMTERGAIIIDGRTIVVSGQVGGNRAKAAVLQAIAPLTEAGLELEDRILGGSSLAGRPSKAPSSTTPSQKSPAAKAPVLAASPNVPSAAGPPKKVLSPKTPSEAVALTPKISTPTAPSSKTSSLVVALAPKAPPLPATSSAAEISPASLQKKLNEILARSSIEFDSKSATMTPSSLATLDQLITELRQSPRTAIEIGGHTDKYGEPDYNIQLSQRRADAVRRY